MVLIAMAFNKPLEIFLAGLDFLISDSNNQTKLQKGFRLCTGVLLVLAVIVELLLKWNKKVQDIQTFLAIVDSMGYLSAALMSLTLVTRSNNFNKNPNLVFLNPPTKTSLSFDTAMSLLTGFTMFLLTVPGFFLEQWLYLFIVVCFFETIFLFNCIVLKYFLLKRMNALRDNIEYEDLLITLRIVLAENSRVNEAYFLQLAGWLFRAITVCFHSLSTYWDVYGLHSHQECYEWESPILTIFVQGHSLMLYAILAMVSTRFQDSVSV